MSRTTLPRNIALPESAPPPPVTNPLVAAGLLPRRGRCPGQIQRGSRLRLTLKLVMTGLLVGLVLYRIDWRITLQALAGVKVIWLFVIAFAVVVRHAVRAWRWQLLLLDQSVRIPFASLFRTCLASALFDSILPANVAGDAFRIKKAGATAGLGRAGVTVLLDRVMGLLVQILLAAVGLYFMREMTAARLLGLESFPAGPLVAGIAAGLVLLLLLVGLRVLPLGRYLRTGIRKILLQAGSVPVSRTSLILAGLLSIPAQLLIVACWVGGLYALGLEEVIPLTFMLFAVPVVSFCLMIPVSLSGIGVADNLFALFFAPFGLGPEIGVAFAWTVILASRLPVAVLGSYFFLRDRTGRPAEAQTRTQTPEYGGLTAPAAGWRPHCRICRGRSFDFFAKKNGFRLERCRSCSLLQITDDLSSVCLSDYYQQEFFQDTYGDLLEDKGRRNAYEKYSYRMEEIEKLRPGKGRLLDIGCSFGFFLDAARRRGWETSGVEIGDYAADYARTRLELDVQTSDLAGAGFAPQSFDVITLWDVIEHLDDPAAELRRIHRLLKPGGLLALNTPNVDSYLRKMQGMHWRCFIPPIHITYFGPRSLTEIIRQTGFRTLEQTVALPRELLLQRFRLFGLLKRLKFSDKLLVFAEKA